MLGILTTYKTQHTRTRKKRQYLPVMALQPLDLHLYTNIHQYTHTYIVKIDTVLTCYESPVPRSSSVGRGTTTSGAALEGAVVGRGEWEGEGVEWEGEGHALLMLLAYTHTYTHTHIPVA